MKRGRKPDTSLDKDIAGLAAQGLARGEIASHLDISRARLNAAIIRLDLRVFDGRAARKACYDIERASEIARLYKGGRTLQSIGQQFGISRERVRQVLRKRTDLTRTDGGQAVVAARRREDEATKRDQAYMKKLGCGWDEYKRIRDVGRDLIKAGAAPCKAPLIAFLSQKRSAGQRGIGWHLSFWDWWTIWLESGRWAQRGRGQGYVMCRKADIGPYTVGNVFIATAIENTSSSKHNKSGLPIGVSFKLGAYYAHRMIGGKKRYLGRHRTPALAYAAYVAAAPPAPAIGLVFPTTQRPDA